MLEQERSGFERVPDILLKEEESNPEKTVREKILDTG